MAAHWIRLSLAVSYNHVPWLMTAGSRCDVADIFLNLPPTPCDSSTLVFLVGQRPRRRHVLPGWGVHASVSGGAGAGPGQSDRWWQGHLFKRVSLTLWRPM